MKEVLIVCVMAVGIISTPTGAHAWSNGTEGCNSYGTHDWILDQALQAVCAAGRLGPHPRGVARPEGFEPILLVVGGVGGMRRE